MEQFLAFQHQNLWVINGHWKERRNFKIQFGMNGAKRLHIPPLACGMAPLGAHQEKHTWKWSILGGGEAWGGVACGWCVVQRRDLVIWFCPPEQNWRSSKSQKSQKLPTKGFPPVWVTTTPNRKPGFAYGWNFNTGGGGLLNWVGESNLFGGLHKPSVLSSCRQIQIQGWVRVRVREVVFSAFVPM